MVSIKLAVVFLFIGAGRSRSRRPTGARHPAAGRGAQGGQRGGDTGAPLIQVLFGIEPLAYGWLGIEVRGGDRVLRLHRLRRRRHHRRGDRKPQRDMPIGILGSLTCRALLRRVTGADRHGQVHRLNTAAPMADALKAVGYDWIASLVSLGALAGLTTVILILLMGQSRVLFAMSRDRLLPGGCPRSTRATARPG